MTPIYQISCGSKSCRKLTWKEVVATISEQECHKKAERAYFEKFKSARALEFQKYPAAADQRILPKIWHWWGGSIIIEGPAPNCVAAATKPAVKEVPAPEILKPKPDASVLPKPDAGIDKGNEIKATKVKKVKVIPSDLKKLAEAKIKELQKYNSYGINNFIKLIKALGQAVKGKDNAGNRQLIKRLIGDANQEIVAARKEGVIK